jgi:hypothetical protein
MDISLRLTADEEASLVATARVVRRPVDDVILEIVRAHLAEREHVSGQVRDHALRRIVAEDAELLHRLADS